MFIFSYLFLKISEKPKPKVVKIEEIKVKLLDFKPPKWVSTGGVTYSYEGVFYDISVSKHCNGWDNKIFINKMYKMNIIHYDNNETKFSPIESEFCD